MGTLENRLSRSKELNSQSEIITETSSLIHKMETSITHITHQTESADNQANMLFTIADEGKKSMLSTLHSIQNVENKSVQIRDLSGMISYRMILPGVVS